MILHCNYEEVQALRHGAEAMLGSRPGEACTVITLPTVRATVEVVLTHLQGDVDVATLAELRSIEAGLEAIVAHLRIEMEAAVGATHPAEESAVAAYFEFAHAFSVLARAGHMGSEMEALIEIMTGSPADVHLERSFEFSE